MRIRPAVPEDNEALCRMDLLAPQGTAIRLTERRTDYFARARLFPGSLLLVAENDGGGLAGVLGGAPFRLRVGGSGRLGAYLFDLRANPERPRNLSRIIFRLWQEMERRLLDRGVEFIFGLVKEDNPAASIYRRMGAVRCGGRTFWTLPVVRRRYTAASGVEIRTGLDTAADYRQAEPWYEAYDLWPLHEDPALLQPAADRYLRAELAVGASSMKIWDTSADAERVVAGMPIVYHLARPLADVLGTVLPVPRIPKPGQRLRTWYLYDLRLADRMHLRPLLSAARRMARAECVDFLVFSAADGEPELAPAGRGALIRLRYDLVIKEYRPLPALSPRAYLDIRCI